MSSAGSGSVSQTPRQEILDRLTEQSPVLGLPRLVAVESLRATLADARSRVKDSHRRQEHVLNGVTGASSEANPAEDDMGGISVAGDTTIHMAAPPQQTSTGMSTLAKVGIGAALTAAGVGLPLAGAAVFALLDKDQPAVVAPVEPGQPASDRDTYLPYDFGIE
jgi:hypothetical protein